MKTIVVVEGQKLAWYGKLPELADNSIQFVQFQFNLPEDWAELEVVAQFTQTKTYNKLLENGCCYLPAELVAGPCEVSLFGQRAGETVRATSVPLRFKISRSGFTSTAETPIPPTPDLYAQLLEKLGHQGPSESVSVEDDGEGNVSFAPGFEGDGEDHELNSLNTGKTVYTSFTDRVAREGLRDKLANPGGLIPGKLLRVKSVDSEGNILLEGVDMPEGSSVVIDPTLTIAGQAADAKATGDAISKLSKENVTMSAAQINALDGMFRVASYDEDAEYTAAYVAFCEAFGLSAPDSGGDTGKTLSSISATYSGGSVPAGTAVSALTGVVVTAHYSDGSTAAVTGYTLTGTIAEGSNIITVAYQDKTATLTVIGTADTGGGDSGSNESTWTDGVAYEWTTVVGEYVDKNNGSFVSYTGYSRTPYLTCAGAEILRAEVVKQSASMSVSNSSYNAFYDAERRFISVFHTVDTNAPAVGTYTDIEIPANAAYFIVSHKDNVMGETSSGTPYIRLIPYQEVPV